MRQNRDVVEDRERRSFTRNREVLVSPAILDAQALGVLGLVSFIR